MNIKTSYWRKLPHFQPIGAAFFVTFRLFGSIPNSVLNLHSEEYKNNLHLYSKIKNKEERKLNLTKLRYDYLIKHDQLLHQVKSGPKYLLNEQIAKVVQGELLRFDKELYKLLCYTIMSNHVHILIDTSIQIPADGIIYDGSQSFKTLDQILKRIKGSSAIYCNRILNRKGQFWERESYDVYIRNKKMLKNVITYILNNPEKAGIVNDWIEYKWNYIATMK